MEKPLATLPGSKELHPAEALMSWLLPTLDPPPEKEIILVIGDGFVETVVLEEGLYYPYSNHKIPGTPPYTPDEVWGWVKVPYLESLPDEVRPRIRGKDLKEPGQRVALLNPSKKWAAAGNEFEFIQAFEEWSDALLFLHIPTGERKLLGKHNVYEVLDD